MSSKEKSTGATDERGVVITLVAVFMLFVVGAMAALSIDVVTLYTARSEAQLAADAGALAGARALANSGATFDANLLLTETSPGGSASIVAAEVATQNQVGGTSATAIVSFDTTSVRNPKVTVQVTTNSLPTFFSRIWGTKQLSATARAKAEAYNASPDGSGGVRPPIATTCVKPWVLPNMDPSPGGTTIFDAGSGTVTNNSSLVNFSSNGNAATRLSTACPSGSDCASTTPTALKYYPLDLSNFAAPSAVSECTPALTPANQYQQSIAGCITQPIACNDRVPLDLSRYDTRNPETTDAINCLTHANGNGGDTIASPSPPAGPFVYLGGTGNPIPGSDAKELMVSSSLVTIPVYDNTVSGPPANTVQVIGFVRLFLNPLGRPTRTTGGNSYQTRITVIDLVGCGDGIGARSGPPILGNGSSPIAVRLVSLN